MSGCWANGPARGVTENGVERAANAPGPIAGVLVSEGHACAAPNIASRPARFVSGA